MSLPTRLTARVSRLPAVLRARLPTRPAGAVEGTRWLFLVFGLVSLAMTLPPTVVTATPVGAVVATASCLVLAASWWHGYRRARATVTGDLVDTVAFAAFVTVAPVPGQALGFVFAALWFRSLYGSARRAYARVLLHIVGLSVGLGAAAAVAGGSPGADAPAVLGSYPLMLLTVAVLRELAVSIRDRELAARRDAALVALSTDLLAESDQEAIYRRAWIAAAEICDATPGLRILAVTQDGAALRVRGSTGELPHLPARVPLDVVGPDAAGRAVRLDEYAGASCHWAVLPLPELGGTGWMLVGSHGSHGSHGSVGDHGVLAARALVNQVALAVRNGAAREALVVQASTDALTGLANRSAFERTLADVVTSGAGASLLFLDLDDFKHVNDGQGHAAGDLLLQVVASRLVEATRPGDVRARLGGDEFAIVLPGTDPDEARRMAERLLAVLCRPVVLHGRPTFVAASVGVAHTRDAGSPEELLQHADIAMYAAKAHGKRAVHVYRPAATVTDGAAVFARQLAAAAGRGELELHYQPVLDLSDGGCRAVEALVRWRHPARGLLGPAEFISQAERTGAIHGIGAWVVRQACADAAAWRAEGLTLAVHVNVSPVQLADDALLGTVRGALGSSGLAPDDLVLEITESTILEAPDALARLHHLASLGVRVAVDDFGTGYAALTTLRTLPASIVKIDRSFVAGAGRCEADLAAIEAIVRMSRRLGLEVVGEGVETPEQHRVLVDAGAHAAQGFLYLRPVPAAELVAWWRTHHARAPLWTAGGHDHVLTRPA
ncbi:bifunctional diguanylate cyclase/phosphodiesterase [uncultured Cellulomonas sp.]|uniref:putative bifunctional diguanylate cyclase/phosphodiesterase n=1 Tax=uncultured Cellulomonas sp. TaxID=189682 RepID=UPI00263465D3|nr:EAL domain-containing protein [uncultured Cellulomonas sp.]